MTNVNKELEVLGLMLTATRKEDVDRIKSINKRLTELAEIK